MTFSLDMGTAPAVADVPQSVRRPTRWTQRPWFVNAVAVAFLLAVWQYLIIANARIPGLDEVIAFLAREVAGRSHGGMAAGEFWSPLGVSLQRYVAGLAIGLPLGAVLGAAAPWLGWTVVPLGLVALLAYEHAYVQAGQSVPLA